MAASARYRCPKLAPLLKVLTLLLFLLPELALVDKSSQKNVKPLWHGSRMKLTPMGCAFSVKALGVASLVNGSTALQWALFPLLELSVYPTA